MSSCPGTGVSERSKSRLDYATHIPPDCGGGPPLSYISAFVEILYKYIIIIILIYIYAYIYVYNMYIHVNGSQQGWHTTNYIPSAYFDAHYVMNFTVEIK